jgi:hypothetical protein
MKKMNLKNEMGEGFKGGKNNNEKYENRTRAEKINRNMDVGIAQCLHS